MLQFKGAIPVHRYPVHSHKRIMGSRHGRRSICRYSPAPVGRCRDAQLGSWGRKSGQICTAPIICIRPIFGGWQGSNISVGRLSRRIAGFPTITPPHACTPIRGHCDLYQVPALIGGQCPLNDPHARNRNVEQSRRPPAPFVPANTDRSPPARRWRFHLSSNIKKI